MAAELSFLKNYQDTYLNQFPPLPEELREDYSYYSCRKDSVDKQIYLLQYRETSRKFLLKSTLLNSSESVVREYQIISSLKEAGCPGVPKVYGLYSDQERDYLLEEYISGITLYDHIEAGRDFTVPEILSIGMQLCEILSFFHNMEPSIIHRDVSPKNIILSAGNRVSIIDMGIARAYQDDKGEDTYVSGTPVTAPPEQFGYGQTDPRSDIYSCGILLYYLSQKSFQVTPQSLAFLPKGLSHIIRKCTAFSPDKRYKSINSVYRKLKRLSHSIHYSDSRKVFLFHYRRQWALCGFLFLLLAASFLGIVMLKKSLAFYEEPVVFTYPVIEEAVREELDFSPDTPITRNDLRYIHRIAICGDTVYDQNTNYEYEMESRLNGVQVNGTGTIQDLSDFSMMPNLSSLSLPNQIITDITPLKGLPLKELNLAANFIADFTPITGTKSLESLTLSANLAKNYEFVSGFTALETLNLDDDKLPDLDFLSSLKLKYLSINRIELAKVDYSPLLSQKSNLEELRVSNCPEDISSYINQFTGLSYLRYNSSKIASLDELNALPQLRQLHLHGSTITSLDKITLFPHLSYLGISNTKITDISPLTDLKELTGLDITNLNIADYSPISKIEGLKTGNLWCSEQQRALIDQ